MFIIKFKRKKQSKKGNIKKRKDCWRLRDNPLYQDNMKRWK